MKAVWLCLSTAALMFALSAPARADCQCVAAGKRYQLGEVACLSGNRLARCGMVLNNSSWETLNESCPLAFNDTMQTPLPHSHAASADDTDHHSIDVIKTGSAARDY